MIFGWEQRPIRTAAHGLPAGSALWRGNMNREQPVGAPAHPEKEQLLVATDVTSPVLEGGDLFNYL